MTAAATLDIYNVAVHIGEAVRSRLKASGIPITHAAASLNTTAKTLHSWFKKPTWDSGNLLACSKLLKEDLFQLYSSELRAGTLYGLTASEPAGEYQRRAPASVEITIKSTGTSGELVERIIRAVEDPAIDGTGAQRRISQSTTTRRPLRPR